MLSDFSTPVSPSVTGSGLNAPYGAPRFLTPVACRKPVCGSFGLNPPYGAPCFLTVKPKKSKASKIES